MRSQYPGSRVLEGTRPGEAKGKHVAGAPGGSPLITTLSDSIWRLVDMANLER